MKKLGRGMPSHKIQELWDEYEDSATKEAVFVRDMNLIDMCLQALTYEKQGRYTEVRKNKHFAHFKRLDEFFATAGPRIRTTTGKTIFEEIYGMYRLVVDEK
jgi:putative hydrolase of HD superfamily